MKKSASFVDLLLGRTVPKLALALTLLVTSTSAHAFFTECKTTKELTLLNRPDGNADPRTSALEKGAKVGFRDSFKTASGEWWFVLPTEKEGAYGWVRKSNLTSCKGHEGTP